MQLFNSLSGRKEMFQPAEPGRPTMYVCGPTVYDHPHIGNARPAVVFDVLFRLLKRRFGDVAYVRNVTDIEDKIMAAAAAAGASTDTISTRYAIAYHDDMAALNVLPPTVEPYATGHVPEMIAMIERLVAEGNAYEAEGHVLFHVPSFPGYGALSRRSRDEMIEGARVEVAPYKRDAADFVLWKPSTDEQPGWDSPWGRGRPGWHIECSAMVAAHLGVTIDIHGGGLDLKFPHHENEIAQSTCAHDGAPLARFWLHNGFLDVEREKMSKSLGNVLLVRDLLPHGSEIARRKQGEVIRYALLAAHYRKPLDWSDASLTRARRALDALYTAKRDLPGPDEVPADAPMPHGMLAALEDDLNTPKAFAELRSLVRKANASSNEVERRALKAEFLSGGQLLLGLLEQDWREWFQSIAVAVERAEGKGAASASGASIAAAIGGAAGKGTASGRGGSIDATEVERLIELRAAARKAKNFAEADRIRDQLAAEGVILEDQAGGTRWRLAG
jgi:cysteinyl-tRNA synthetase